MGPLGPVELALERALPRAGSTSVAPAQARDARAAGHDGRVAERASAERIADANVAIQIRQWRNAQRVRLVVLDHDREPEAQLAEPHGRGVDVDAEDRSGEEGAADRDRAAYVSAAGEQTRQLLEGVHEKRAGAAGGIEDRQVVRAMTQHRRSRRVDGTAVEHGAEIVLAESRHRERLEKSGASRV
jgi:hypothetical protein